MRGVPGTHPQVTKPDWLIESTLSLSHLAGLFSRFKSLVQAERYVILLGPDDRGEFVLAQSHGLEEDRVDLLDTEVVRRVCAEKQAFLTEEAAQLASVLCVPLLGNEKQVVGLVYAEDRSGGSAFHYTDLLNVQNLIQQLHLKAAPQPARAPMAPVARAATRSAPRLSLRPQDQVLFLVQLATFVKAGIPLLSGLDALARQNEASKIGQLADRASKALLSGRSLAASLEQNALFPAFVIGQLRCAEQSGQLALSLDLLARNLEKQRTRALRLSGALAYPGFLMALCLAMSALLPTYLLKGQLEFYQAQKMSLPGLSLALLRFGQAISSPLTWLALAGCGYAGYRWLRPPERREKLRELCQRGGDRLPWLSRVQRLHWECRLVSSLQMLLHSGVGLLESLPMAIDTTGSYFWRQQQPQLLNDILSGDTLAQALGKSGMISRPTGSLLAAGEEAGQTVGALGWIGQMLEMDFDASLDTASKLLEPLVMAVMGIVVGFVTLASLMPSIRYIQNL